MGALIWGLQTAWARGIDVGGRPIGGGSPPLKTLWSMAGGPANEMAVPKGFPVLVKVVPELLEILLTYTHHRSAIGRH